MTVQMECLFRIKLPYRELPKTTLNLYSKQYIRSYRISYMLFLFMTHRKNFEIYFTFSISVIVLISASIGLLTNFNIIPIWFINIPLKSLVPNRPLFEDKLLIYRNKLKFLTSQNN